MNLSSYIRVFFFRFYSSYIPHAGIYTHCAYVNIQWSAATKKKNKKNYTKKTKYETTEMIWLKETRAKNEPRAFFFVAVFFASIFKRLWSGNDGFSLALMFHSRLDMQKALHYYGCYSYCILLLILFSRWNACSVFRYFFTFMSFWLSLVFISMQPVNVNALNVAMLSFSYKIYKNGIESDAKMFYLNIWSNKKSNRKTINMHIEQN